MSLFWKIFITFGITMSLTLVAAVSISFRLVSQAYYGQFDIENREEIIKEAAQVLAGGGADQLRTWLRQHQRPIKGIMLMIVDDQSRDLLDREIPGRFLGLLSRQRTGRFRGGPSNFRPMQLTPNIVGPFGEEYRLLFVPTRITVLGVLTWPATQFAVIALVILAATGAALPLARYLALPIERLQRATRALAAGALETRVGAPFDQRRDEVGILARAFDTMAERLQALLTDKEMLLRDVSHELRSPLARIRVALALAQRKAAPELQPDLERIERETENLDELVGQVMTLARLRTQKSRNLEPIDISALVGEIVEDAQFEHPDTHIGFSPLDVSGLIGSTADLRSAIENVVRNALAHSGNQREVEVEIARSARDVEIHVRDGGEGVPEADLEKIFEPFYRADRSRDHRHDGQGIGLAITARVIENHGGTVRAANRPAGGLEVVLTLPLSQS